VKILPILLSDLPRVNIFVVPFAAGFTSLNSFSWKRNALACLLGLGLLCGSAAHAAITEIQPLNFGQWAITNNTGFKVITVNPNGSFSNSPGLFNIVFTPTQGIYRVDSLPPFTTINSVNATMLVPMTGGNQNFTLDTFQVIHDPSTNASGEVNITLGATARTTGTGVPYDDATYTGTIQLEINY
jgi:hypothetical protein